MDRAFVVLDDTDTHRDLLAEAVEITRATGADLELFSWVTPDEVEQEADALEAAGKAEGTTYPPASAHDLVTGIVNEVANDVFDANELPEFDIASAVAEDDAVADEILDAANASGCDHIFLVGRRRSPTGKVLFGDVAQKVILNFDDHVTVTME